MVGILRVEVVVPASQSLKDKRSVIKSLREQLRGRFNIAVAEVEANDTWQRGALGMRTVGEDRQEVQGLLRQVAEWIRHTRLVDLVNIDEDYW